MFWKHFSNSIRTKWLQTLKQTEQIAIVHPKQNLVTRKSSRVTAWSIPPAMYPVYGMCCLVGEGMRLWGTPCPGIWGEGYSLSWSWSGGRGMRRREWVPRAVLAPDFGTTSSPPYPPPEEDLGLEADVPLPSDRKDLDQEAGEGTWVQRLGTSSFLWTDRQTDICKNITFPSYYVRGP